MLVNYWPWNFAFLVGSVLIVLFGRHLLKGSPRMEEDNETTRNFRINGKRPTRAAFYAASLQMLAHTDNLSWSRLYNLLTANSILMLTWATIFVSEKPPERVWALIGISFFGMLLSLSWGAFGSRGRRLHRQFVGLTRQLEGYSSKDGPAKTKTVGPIHAAFEFKFLPVERWFGSRYLTIWAPLGFGIVFLGLFLIAIFQFTKP